MLCGWLGWAGLGVWRAELGWAGLGWAGLGAQVSLRDAMRAGAGDAELAQVPGPGPGEGGERGEGHR